MQNYPSDNHPALIIYAPTINVGGGLILIKQLLNTDHGKSAIVIIDVRAKHKLNSFDFSKFFWVESSLIGRIKAELLLLRLRKCHPVVLCFSNVPPLFSANKDIHLYLQNYLLLTSLKLKVVGFKRYFKILILACILRLSGNKITIIVQTPTMQQRLKTQYGFNSIIAPYNLCHVKHLHDAKKNYDYIYVASGEYHKNHYCLINAFILLASLKLYPSLVLTINQLDYPELYTWIQTSIKTYQLKVFVVKSEYMDISYLYAISRALVFPSEYESLGLPLLEAQYLGLDILASERDYVRDIVNPIQTFDPVSPRSIARAIIRYQYPSFTLDKVSPLLPDKFAQFILDLNKY